ncbi:MAG: Holliday junction resolvase RuvX [Clostridia bacterium]|nr:Holliday junction resolvase RuvX [Clostridia bacterium]
MRYMGIDYGDARVGVALSDPLGMMAQRFTTVQNTGGKKMFLQLLEIIKEKDVGHIVIGMPKNMDGTEGFRAEETYAFAERLKTYTDIEISFWDERLTTVAAHGYLSELDVRGKKRKDVVDAVSAELILEGYMNSLSK